MLPTHGTVTSVFHLANSIRHFNAPNAQAWKRAASSRSSFLSAAIEHAPIAQFLIEEHLVTCETGIAPSPILRALSEIANRTTLVAIARLLLKMAPPSWLQVAVDNRIHYELIPTADLDGLAWLRPELDQLLLDAANRSTKHSEIAALGIGRAAELVILEALNIQRFSPIHVSEISDHFGYDIETVAGPIRRWEVKGCTKRTSLTFHLSRNEFEVSKRHSGEWALVQVEFEPEVITAEFVTASHIRGIREMRPNDLAAIVPADSDAFRWEESALITPPAKAWSPSDLPVPRNLHLDGIGALGKEAWERRIAI